MRKGRTECRRNACECIAGGLVLFAPLFAAFGQFVAFNDYAPGGGTHTNATVYAPGGGGRLKNIDSGAAAAANVLVYSSGVTLVQAQGSSLYATPAYIVFDGYVDFVGDPNPGIELSDTSYLTYFFSGLDANSEYNLQATAIRGESTYADRWSLFQLGGARGFTSAHTAGA